MKSWRSVALILTLLILGDLTAGLASGPLQGTVTRVQLPDIVVSLGEQVAMRPGSLLYIYDAMGHPVATVRVVQVDEISSHVELISMEPDSVLSLGEQVSDKPYTPAPLPAHPQTPVASGSPQPATSPGPSHAASAPTTSPVMASGEGIVKNFRKVLKTHTQVWQFNGGKGGALKINAFDVLNIISSMGVVGPGQGAIANPWLITGSAYDTYNTYSYTRKINRRAKSFIQIVYWDQAMSAAYADYYLYKENIADPVQQASIRRSLMAQKGVQTSAVFQIKIRNMGPGTLQLSPFDWHCYLLDPQGNRVKAERYDEILDKALNPGQEVDGYIYFPRRNPMGQSYVGDPPSLMLDDVFGEHARVTFHLK